MSVHLSIQSDAQAFLAVAGPMLYAHETVNNLILGVSERLSNEPTAYENPFFATISRDDGVVILAAVMTPPHNLILAGEEQAELGFPILIDHLHGHQIHVPGVIGPAETAEAFSQAWVQMNGGTAEVSMRQRVYELHQVRMPEIPTGEFRMASTAEIPIIAEWIQAFEAEALEKSTELDVARADRLVARGMMYVWSLGREIVSMAMKTRPIAHSITIGEVYTPPEHRRRGYAGMLVACLSQHLLDEGYQFVNLFTDLDNPTSNKIYQDLGYQPVCDFRMYRFTVSPE
jgi:uncharacterized protein